MIATHHAPHMNHPWIAVDMDAAAELLEEYDLTDEEKTSLPALMEGYCRLIDEAGLCHYGQTEEEAVKSAQQGSQP